MTKKGQDLPDEHEVMRFVPWKHLRKDEDQNVLGFLGEAFKLRPGEDELSVNWLEFFPGKRDERIKQSVEAFRRILDVRPKAAFGIARVDKVKQIAKDHDAAVRILYFPIEAPPAEKNLAHAEVRKLPREDFELLESLALDAFVQLVKNADI